MLKRLKRLSLVIFAGFMAFAPPGTLILAGALGLRLLGRVWFFGGVLCCAVFVAIWLLRRGRSARGAANEKH